MQEYLLTATNKNDRCTRDGSFNLLPSIKEPFTADNEMTEKN
jgi:hypothetical protein